MRQWGSLPRALFLMIDEPLGALDALTCDNVRNRIVRIWQEALKTILPITHAAEEAVARATFVAPMKASPGALPDRVATPFSGLSRQDVSRGRDLRPEPPLIKTRGRGLANVVGTHRSGSLPDASGGGR